MRRRSRERILVPLLLLGVAAGLRLWGLSTPSSTYWDEAYYPFDADAYLGGFSGIPVPNEPAVRIRGEITWNHPPLGKWMIVLSDGPIGFRPLGWRLSSAVFGTATVLLLYLLALALWGSPWWAGLSAFLLAIDGLHLVQSRIAMLDVFVTFFAVCGVLALALEPPRGDPAGRPSGRLLRLATAAGGKHRLYAGLAFGAAVATKWSGLWFLLLGAGIAIARDRGDSGLPGRKRSARILVAFVVAPAVVYLASYWQFFAQHGPDVRDFAVLQWRMFQQQVHHATVQPENSAPITWPLLLHPIRYFPLAGVSGPRILALGNPVLWWSFLAALPPLALRAIRRLDRAAAFALGGWAAAYLPWFVLRRPGFLFYMTPAIPFMCLGVAAALRGFPGRARMPAALALTGFATAAAVLFAPVWLGLDVGRGWIRATEWLAAWR